MQHEASARWNITQPLKTINIETVSDTYSNAFLAILSEKMEGTDEGRGLVATVCSAPCLLSPLTSGAPDTPRHCGVQISNHPTGGRTEASESHVHTPGDSKGRDGD